MKKVLIVSSSPRKNGNSDLLAQEFAKGAAEAGNQVETLSLREKKIGYCLACGYCMTHDGQCALRDDAAQALDQMLAADVIVLATPVYYYSVSAQMKTLIDRTYARFTQMNGKEFYFIATSADPGEASVDGALQAFRGFLSCLPGAVEKGVLYGVGNADHGDVRGKPQLAEAYQMGKGV